MNNNIQEPVVIADNGVALADIVVSDNASENLRSMVVLLRADLEKVTGAEFQVVTQATVTKEIEIIIGDADEVACDALPLYEIYNDGYIIWCNDNRIHLIGSCEQGTINAVAGFLHDVVGVRHYAADESLNFSPRKRVLELSRIQKVFNPAFPIRAITSHNANAEMWQCQNRVLLYEAFPFSLGSTEGAIFDYQTFGESHPEYFALINGRRKIPLPRSSDNSKPGTANGMAAQPCFTNQGVIQAVVDTACKYFDIHPERLMFDISINNTSMFCECDCCDAVNQQDSGSEQNRSISYSNVYFSFVNAVAREVQKSHPDKLLKCRAYNEVIKPPSAIEQIEENVCIFLTQDSACDNHSEDCQLDRKLLKHWQSICSHIALYIHNNTFCFLPQIYPKAFWKHIKNAHSIGLNGISLEVHPVAWLYADPQLYLATRLFWEPELNVNSVLNQYYKDLFEDVAGAVKQFYDYYEQIGHTLPQKNRSNLVFSQMQFELYTLAEVDYAHTILTAAYEKTKVKRVRDRLKVLIEYHKLVRDCMAAYEISLTVKDSDGFRGAIATGAKSLEALERFQASNHQKYFSDTYYDAMVRWFAYKVRDNIVSALLELLPGTSQVEFRENINSLCDDSIIREVSIRQLQCTESSWDSFLLDYATLNSEQAVLEPFWQVEQKNQNASGTISYLTELTKDGLGIRLSGSGIIVLKTRIKVKSLRSYLFILPVIAKQLNVFSELKLQIAWLDSEGLTLALQEVHFADMQKSILLKTAAQAHEQSKIAEIHICFQNINSSEGVLLAPLEVINAETQNLKG
jgi:Domain of unknown function (DUF4838)